MKGNREKRGQRVLLVPRVQWEKQGLLDHRDTLETLVQRVCVGFQALLGSKG